MRGVEKKALNPQGGMAVKGGHAPTLLAEVNLAAPQASGAPTPVEDVSTGGSPYKYWNDNALSRWLAWKIWAEPSWMVSGPGCWSTMVPELTQ